MDDETRIAIKRMAAAVDSVAGMVAGCSAYIAALEGAAFVDRRRAVGLSHRMLPEGLTGDTQTAAVVAHAMIEEIAKLAREIQTLKQRSQNGEPRPLSRDWQGRPAELNPLLDV